jgi:hypothetical protein
MTGRIRHMSQVSMGGGRGEYALALVEVALRVKTYMGQLVVRPCLHLPPVFLLVHHYYNLSIRIVVQSSIMIQP